MKKIFCLFLILLACSNSFAQTNFEKGYFITDAGNKIDCLIRNLDWKNTPTEFEYKLTESDKVEIGNIQTVKEFGLTNTSKYVRFSGGVDETSMDLNNYSTERDPKYTQKTLFLKVLKEADVSLYSYDDRVLNLYFFKKKDGEIQQLINKPYYFEQSDKVAFNQYYKRQLLAVLSCQEIYDFVTKAGYNKSDLTTVFERYYKCSGQTVKDISNKSQRAMFSISIKPGISMRSFEYIRDDNAASSVDFGNKMVFRIGAEFEYIMPFNNNKWSFFAEPNYEAFEFQKEIPTYGNVKVDVKALYLPIGLRHSFFLNNQSKIFFNLIYNITLSSTGNSSYEFAYQDIKISNLNGINLGLGYKFKDRYSIEFRTGLGGNINTNHPDLQAKSNAMSLIFGYTLFNTKKN